MNALRLFCVLFSLNYFGSNAWLYSEEPKDSLIVFKDDEVYRALPKRFLFSDVEDSLFRSGDGKELHLGPGKEGVFFVLSPDGEVQVHIAPSLGKAYLDQTGDFAIWYDTLADGISFKNGDKISFEQPSHTRFGVSYDAAYFYITQTNTTQVFATQGPKKPLVSIAGFYSYKLVAEGDEFYLAGYSYLGHEEMRTHQYRRYLKVENQYILMDSFELPEHLVMLDLNPYEKTALFLNDSEMVPQLYLMSLHDQVTKSLGMVQYYGFFLHPSFRKVMPPPSLPKNRL